MKTEETVLKNGAKIIGIKMPNAKSVVINFGFRVGSRDENPVHAGLSHFLEHMMFKGSQKRPSAAMISKEADRIGARYNAFTGKEYTCYYIKVAENNFELGLDIIGDMVTRPLIKEAEIKKEVGTIIEEIKMYNDNPMINISGKMEETFFGFSTDMGRDIAGNTKSVKKINSKIMRNYFENNYVGVNSILVLAGNLPGDYLAKSKKYLQRLPLGQRSYRSIPRVKSGATRIIQKKTEQAHFGICLEGYSINQKDKYAAEIIATALGGYMSARLFTEIREKRGWAYQILAYNDISSDSGYLGIVGGIKKDKIKETLEIVKKEITMFEKNFKKEEIERAKSHLNGSFTLRFDDPEERAKYTVLQDLLTDKKETPEDFIKKVQAVSNKDIKRVAKKIFTGKAPSLTIIGPYQNKEKFAKILTR